jgi:hypothetical protein
MQWQYSRSVDGYVCCNLAHSSELVLHLRQLQSLLLMHGLLYTGFCLDDLFFLSVKRDQHRCNLLLNCIWIFPSNVTSKFILLMFQYPEFWAATYPNFNIVSTAMISECPFNAFNIHCRWLCLSTIIIAKYLQSKIAWSRYFAVHASCMPLNLLCQTVL